MTKRRRLKKLQIETFTLCGSPVNPGARVLLAKAELSLDDVLLMLPEEARVVVMASIEAAKKSTLTLTDKPTDDPSELEGPGGEEDQELDNPPQPPAEPAEEEEEEEMKPEEMQKALAEQITKALEAERKATEERIAKMQKEADERVAKAEAEVKRLSDAEQERVDLAKAKETGLPIEVVKAARGLSGDARKAIFEHHARLMKGMEAAGMFGELGRSGRPDGSADPVEGLAQIAKAIREKDPSINRYRAMEMAAKTDEGRELYAKHVEDQRRARG